MTTKTLLKRVMKWHIHTTNDNEKRMMIIKQCEWCEEKVNHPISRFPIDITATIYLSSNVVGNIKLKRE